MNNLRITFSLLSFFIVPGSAANFKKLFVIMGNKASGSNKNKGKGSSKHNSQNHSPKKIKFSRKATIPQSKLDRVKITKSLNLEKCKYSSIPSNLFTIDQLEIVNLNDNAIKSIAEDLIPPFDQINSPEKKQNESDDPNKKSKKSKHKYKGIKLFRMSNNRLSTLPRSFAYLHNLQTLQLINNEFEIFPFVLFELPKLKELSLKKNKISSIECSLEIIEGVKKLEDLDLSFNALHKLPDSFTHLKSLKLCNFEHNQLTSLPISWKGMESLHIINFRNNNLSDIPPSLFLETGVVRVDIENNPVHTSKKYVHLEGFDEVQCVYGDG